MRRWLFVANNINYWMELDEDELNFPVEEPVRRGDKVLVYKTSPHTHFSHIFRVKNDAYMEAESYPMVLYDKITIENPVTLKELKKRDYLCDFQSCFRKSFYPIDLCTWGKIIGCILQKNPGLLEPFEAEGCYGPHNEGFPLNHKTELFQFLENIKTLNFSSFDEEETKYRIILPLLSYLGWNIYDLHQIYPEYLVKSSIKKVDYLLTDHKSNKIFIEAKKPKVNLDVDEVKCQLIKYCAAKNIDLGILTNGIKWRLYNLDYYDNTLGAIKNWKKDEIDLIKNDPEDIFDKFISIFWSGNTCHNGRIYESKSIDEILTEVRNIKNIHDYNESAVKQVIVLPLLAGLGWDINSDFKFDVYKNGKKIDYIIGKGKNKFFMEVKALTDDLENYDTLERYETHIQKYGDAACLDFGVLTNGKIWKFYHLKTRDRIKIKIDNNNHVEKFQSLLSKKKVNTGFNITYLEKLALNS